MAFCVTTTKLVLSFLVSDGIVSRNAGGITMAVVCSKGLIGKAVCLGALGSTAPVMIVTDVEESSKKVAVGWLDKNNGYNNAVFPSSSLDKADNEAKTTKPRTTKTTAKKKK
jgi:hypothetical protein